MLVWLGAFAAAAGAALTWANLATFAGVLDRATVTVTTDGAIVLSAAAVAFALLGQARRWIGAQARAVWASLFVVIAAASVVVPIASRGRGTQALLEARPIDAAVDAVPAEPPSRGTVIAIDAASLDFITAATTEGRLPNFGRMLDAGAVMHLATLRPTSQEAVWAAVSTGKLPQKNGVRSAGLYRVAGGGWGGGGNDAIHLLPNYCYASGLVRFGFLVPEPHTSAALRTRTLWGILGTQGLSVGVVGWPLTQPAPAMRGYLVSDTYQRVALTPSGILDSSAIYPADMQDEVAQAMDAALTEFPAAAVVTPGTVDPRFEAPARTDRIYDRIARELGRTWAVPVTLTRYQSLDPIGHYFLRYAMPSAFGDVTDEERRTRGSVLERHYGIVDEAIGRGIAALGPDDQLLVVSGYGMEPLSLGQRIVERVIGDPDVSGTYESAPDGFLMAYGSPVARGRRAERASLVDVLPTLLYFLGLPVGRDMDGYARTELFQPSFMEDRPITFIPTYDR